MKRIERFILAFILSFLLLTIWGKPARAAFEPTACSNGFLSCVTDQFFSKFPFDIFSSISHDEITCPQLVFFDKPFEFCFLYDSIRILKYPLIASVLIKMYIFS
jgi:hypothetical protein